MPKSQFEEKVKSANDADLAHMLSDATHDSPNWRCIFDEIQLRGINKIGKVHWFQHAANVAAVVAAIASILGVWLMWTQEAKPSDLAAEQAEPLRQNIQQTLPINRK